MFYELLRTAFVKSFHCTNMPCPKKGYLITLILQFLRWYEHCYILFPQIFLIGLHFTQFAVFKLKSLLVDEWCVAADLHALIYILQHAPVLENLTLDMVHISIELSFVFKNLYDCLFMWCVVSTTGMST